MPYKVTELSKSVCSQLSEEYINKMNEIEAAYEKVNIEPQYTLSESMSCTVPSVKGLITPEYKIVSGNYVIDLTIPQGMKADLSVPANAVVNINSELYYQNGEYENGANSFGVETIEK